MRELADHIETPLFLAHIRAAIGSPVQQTNCHPFRYERWLFVHNGFLADIAALRRDLLLAVDPSLFNGIAGSTDSELLFHLALTFGLEHDPLGAMEQAVGLVESKASERGIADPVQGTFGISDGERLWAIRYSSAHASRTLFVSADVEAVRRLHPENERLQMLSEGDRVVVAPNPSPTWPAPGRRSPSRPRWSWTGAAGAPTLPARPAGTGTPSPDLSRLTPARARSALNRVTAEVSGAARIRPTAPNSAPPPIVTTRTASGWIPSAAPYAIGCTICCSSPLASSWMTIIPAAASVPAPPRARAPRTRPRSRPRDTGCTRPGR